MAIHQLRRALCGIVCSFSKRELGLLAVMRFLIGWNYAIARLGKTIANVSDGLAYKPTVLCRAGLFARFAFVVWTPRQQENTARLLRTGMILRRWLAGTEKKLRTERYRRWRKALSRLDARLEIARRIERIRRH